jgi:hypothetical protein
MVAQLVPGVRVGRREGDGVADLQHRAVALQAGLEPALHDDRDHEGATGRSDRDRYPEAWNTLRGSVVLEQTRAGAFQATVTESMPWAGSWLVMSGQTRLPA